ncbi:TIGR03086 family metal-binding protein [Actinokineospora globicatena]|uniref:TIGR03086 family protein n=1 Tax=Actinokineospora globicatena TaxID=103729 RepID=A0A9W6QSR7_9PSEU|nr:TIGR03086 family metal-binding protein [Actinokineospora globicatena]GLW94120.1 TIGR03086 family protein [Actinokineospora globicatena]
MELSAAHDQARDVFDRAAHQVTDWSAPTPCADWSTRELVNHLVSEQLWVPHLVAGETIEQVGDRYDGDLVGDDPLAAWTSASEVSRRAWDGVPDDREVHLSSGTSPAVDYRRQMVLDLAVHGWDLATATGHDAVIDDDLARALLAEFTDQVDQWRDAGIFGPPVPVPADADPPTRLVALLGRDPRWHPSG